MFRLGSVKKKPAGCAELLRFALAEKLLGCEDLVRFVLVKRRWGGGDMLRFVVAGGHCGLRIC